MSTAVNQKEYLKRYLGGGNKAMKEKKKKKKEKKVATKGLKIIDENVGMSVIPYGYADDDEEPTVAEITYENQKEKLLEDFQAIKKWKKLTVNEPTVIDFPPTTQRYDSSYRRQRHDSDNSPLRGQKHYAQASPCRRQRRDSDVLPPRKQRHDSDTTPPRKQRHDSDVSPSRKQRHDSDTTPPRKQRHDSDVSPSRKQRHDSDTTPPRKQRHDSDVSPPRKRRHDSDTTPPRKQRRNSDVSPPRKQRHDSDTTPPRRQRRDSDVSPPRKQRHDSDTTPPRRQRHDSDVSPPRRARNQLDSGKTEHVKLEKPEQRMTTTEFLRARKHGKLRNDTPDDLARKEREGELQKQAEERHRQWNQGVRQLARQRERLVEDAHEMGKAFARTADDVDMNAHLKEITREEDPMLQYLEKKMVRGSAQPILPVYQGPFPPNRFGLRPGYRWDGVDRSSGFESARFQKQSDHKALSEEAYKWSCADM